MVRICFICKWNSYMEPRRSFHKLSTKEPKRKKWLDALGISDENLNKETSVCSIHFDKSCFRHSLVDGRETLEPDSVPTLYLTRNIDMCPEEISIKVEGSQPSIDFSTFSHDSSIGSLEIDESSLQACINQDNEIVTSTFEELCPDQGSYILDNKECAVFNTDNCSWISSEEMVKVEYDPIPTADHKMNITFTDPEASYMLNKESTITGSVRGRLSDKSKPRATGRPRSPLGTRNLRSLSKRKSLASKFTILHRSSDVPSVECDVHLDFTEDLKAPASMNICRVCLEYGVKMYHIGNNKLSQMYLTVTGIQVSPQDNMPQMLCFECVARLASANRFRNKALRSNMALQNLLASKVDMAKFLTVSDVKMINRHSINLQSSLVAKYFRSDVTTETECKEEKSYSDDYSEEIPTKEKCPVVQKKKVLKRKCTVKVSESKVKQVRVKDECPTTTVERYKNSPVIRHSKKADLDETLFTISTLPYDDQIAEMEKRQETSSYKNAPHRCTTCYKVFQRENYLEDHMARHSEEAGEYECFICKIRCKTARKLRSHLTKSHTEKISCNQCTFSTSNRDVAKRHENFHAGIKYQCQHCPREFDKVSTYKTHLRIKHVSKFVCELCGYTFINKKGIEIHKQLKHRLADKSVPLEGPYCVVCDVTFLSEEAHARHLKVSSLHTRDDDPNRIRNDGQGIITSGKGVGGVFGGQRRTPAADRQPREPVTCEQCGTQLRDFRLYTLHFLRAHPHVSRTQYAASKTPVMCELCGKIFASRTHLKYHMFVHTGEKMFKCERCDKTFVNKPQLALHMRVHSATRPTYECPICGKHFTFYSNRRRHMLIHKGLMPFKCDTCGKCFKSVVGQRLHMDHVHLKKPWPKRERARAPPTLQTTL